MRKSVLKIGLLALVLISLGISSCAPTSLKPYERIYLNDPAMQMGLDAGLSFQNYIFTIREGSIPAGTSKASGGCGCN